MKKISHNKLNLFVLISLITIMILTNSCSTIKYRKVNIPHSTPEYNQKIKKLYDECNLSFFNLQYDIFRKAIVGHKYIESNNSNIITIIDFSQPSTAKRFYVIDIKKRKLLFNTFVAHGENTGKNQAINFSNINNSRQSSLGFFKTGETYSGDHGYSIRIDGIEKGINNKARKRDIVIHGADYVSKNFIDENGRLGRSWGCPALPMNIKDKIIDTIKGESCIFVYADDEEYLERSFFIE